MNLDREEFRRTFGREVPSRVLKLFEIETPVRFECSDKPFVVEVQYFTLSKGIKGGDSDDRFVFAVNTDGRDMLIDINDFGLSILQREHEAIDHIGVSVDELLNAEACKIPPTYR